MKTCLFILVLAICLGLPANLCAQDSLNVRLVSFYNTPGKAERVSISEDYAYVADGLNSGLAIICVSIPSSPSWAGMWVTENAKDVAISDDLAYVTDFRSGLRIVNIFDPSSPFEVGACSTSGLAGGVDVSGDYAYVAAGWNGGLRIIDVSDPSCPFETGFFKTQGVARGVVVSGSLAYVVYGMSGLRVVNISDPFSPHEVGFYDTPGNPGDLDISGTLAYVADDGSGLRIIDVSDPTSPFEVGFHKTPSYARGVKISGNYAFVADYYEGLRVINVLDPSSPYEVGFYDAPGFAKDVDVSGDYIYLLNKHCDPTFPPNGLFILEFLGVGVDEEENEVRKMKNAEFDLLQNQPNPFHSTTTIRYVISAEGDQQSAIEGEIKIPVWLGVYDLTGRLMETLVEKTQGPGLYQAHWNPEDAPSGIYFYRLQAGDFTDVKKMILLR